MQPIDIQSILKKYSSGSSNTNNNKSYQLPQLKADKGNEMFKEYSYLQDSNRNQSLKNTPSYDQSNKFSENMHVGRQQHANIQRRIQQQPFYQKFSTYALINTNSSNNNQPSTQYTMSDNNTINNTHENVPNYLSKYIPLNQTKYHYQHKPIQQYPTENIDKTIKQQPSKMTNYQTQNHCQPYNYQSQFNYYSYLNNAKYQPNTKTIQDTKTPLYNFASLKQLTSKSNHLKHTQHQYQRQHQHQSKPQQNIYDKYQQNLMTLFNNQKNTHLNLFNKPQQYLTSQFHQEKPYFTSINSNTNILNNNKTNLTTSNLFKNSTEFTTKPTSNWHPTSQYTTFNNIQPNEPNQFSQKINQKPSPSKQITHQYKKVQSATTNYTPNNQGFIPLHKTKEQIQNDIFDLSDYQYRDKKVYDQLQITTKIKTTKLNQFQTPTLCSWKNNVIYDISTKDDNKNKLLFGKWC